MLNINICVLKAQIRQFFTSKISVKKQNVSSCYLDRYIRVIEYGAIATNWRNFWVSNLLNLSGVDVPLFIYKVLRQIVQLRRRLSFTCGSKGMRCIWSNK